MDEGVSRFIRNPHLKDALIFFVKYVGSSPYDAPALLNLLPYVQVNYGLWYVKGGMYGMAQAMEKLALELGVKYYITKPINQTQVINTIREILRGK